MTVSSAQSLAELKAPRSTVAIVRAFGVSAEAVWQAISDPAALSCWFGDLSPELQPGGTARLDFGDGDFFSLANIAIDAPHELAYTWRFLGIGPVNSIIWRVVPREQGCVLTITDIDPGRTYEGAVAMREGWGDFAWRLEQFVHYRRRSRYDWRREIDVSVALAGQPEQVAQVLFQPERQADWLPFANLRLEAASTGSLPAPDDRQPVTIRDLDRQSATQIRFELDRPGWLQPTQCALGIEAYCGGSLLTVSHTGWQAISDDDDRQRSERKRFCEAWIAAFECAQQVVANRADQPAQQVAAER